jgi:phosphoglycolate phosphatase-like HAD superfamily hydrolase
MTKWAVLDIDGCILNIDHRLPFLLDGDYDTFHKLHHTDVPIPQGVYLYKILLADPNIRVAFSTSRPEKSRNSTMMQLNKLFGYVDFELWMRDDEDDRPDHELKIDAIYGNGLEPYDIFLACDDRNVICEAYRGLGITAYQLDTGY